MFCESISTSTRELDDRLVVVEQYADHRTIGIVAVGTEHEDELDILDLILLGCLDRPLNDERHLISDLCAFEHVEDVGTELDRFIVQFDDDVPALENPVGGTARNRVDHLGTRPNERDVVPELGQGHESGVGLGLRHRRQGFAP